MSKVALVKCVDYGQNRVHAAVKRAIDLVGGIGAFVKPGMKVLVKPNLLSPRLPEEGVDTHPEVVRAVVKLVKEAGGQPMIGDSTGGYGKNIDEVYDKSGMRKLASEEGAELVKFTSSKHVEGMPVSRYVFDSDLIISIPKLKTHGVTILTAAIKNMFGTVVGLHKTLCHAKAPSIEDFAKVIAKVYSISKPGLTVIDGIIAMEGAGPAAGNLRNMNLVMAGSDGVAIDACIARIIGLEPEDILVTKEASMMGLGEADLSRIELSGDDIRVFVTDDFKMPPTTVLKLIPKPIAKSIASMIRFRPVIDVSICTRCNLCKLSCPVHAITIEEAACRIDYKKCVRCLCCHEVCPYKAIHIKTNIFTKLILGGGNKPELESKESK